MSSHSKLDLINRRQRQILVHSFLYYQLSENIISDQTFDAWSKELASLMTSEEAKLSVYYKDFADFEGSTGFYLPYTLPDIQLVGHRLLNHHNKKLQQERDERAIRKRDLQ